MDQVSTFHYLFLVIISINFHNGIGQKAFIVYGNGATSERNLPVCNSPKTACNFIQKRYWLSPMVKRLCKCPDRTECSQLWAEKDKHTVMLNNRAQLKFCGQVGDLNDCRNDEIAAAIETENNPSNGLSYVIEIKCYCPSMHYFNRSHINTSRSLEGNFKSSEFFKCLPFEACATDDFCGHITTTFYETYHVCACPYKHICIMKNRKTSNVIEALYEGKAYKGYCVKYYP